MLRGRSERREKAETHFTDDRMRVDAFAVTDVVPQPNLRNLPRNVVGFQVDRLSLDRLHAHALVRLGRGRGGQGGRVGLGVCEEEVFEALETLLDRGYLAGRGGYEVVADPAGAKSWSVLGSRGEHEADVQRLTCRAGQDVKRRRDGWGSEGDGPIE